MSMTRFMTSSNHSQTAVNLPPHVSDTQPKQTRITYFSSANESEPVTPNVIDPLFDSVDMSRDNIRRHIRQERNALSSTDQAQLALIASRHLLAEIQRISAKKVALYLGFDGELATSKLIEALWKHGVEVYLPKLHPFSKGNLLFLRYDANTEMVSNCYDISEPKLDIRNIATIDQLDMIVTPLVAFDKQGNRMGMGSGFYDRTLAQVNNNKPLAVGYAHDCQQVSFLPIEYWDVPLPVIITPTRRIAMTDV